LIAVYIVAAAEFYLHFAAPQPKTPRFVIAGPHGLRANEPGRTYRHRTAEYTVDLRINNQGMRADTNIAIEKAPGVQRILILGDSFGIGYGANLEDTFLSIMAHELEASGRKVELVNLSVSGLGPAEQLLLLQKEGLQYSPDLIIQCWNITDIADNVRSQLFALENGELVARNEEYLPATRTQQMMSELWLFRQLSSHSELFGLTRERAGETVKKLLAMSRGRKAVAAEKAENGDKTPENGANAGLSYSKRLAVALLKEIEATGESVGAPLLILDIPSHWKRIRYRSTFPYGPDGDDYGFEICGPVHQFSTMTADALKGEAGKKLYWEHSRGHFAPLGNELVGKGMARYIVEHGLLDR
jgi:hypothetical protein